MTDIDDAAQVDSDKYDEILSTTIEKEKEESDNSKEIERRAQVNDFIIQWSKNPDMHYTELGELLKMHPQKVNDYAGEFISVMRQSAENQTFPSSVIQYFNHSSIPSNRRITPLMLSTLAPAVDIHLANIEKPNNSEVISDNVAQQPQNQNPTIPIMPNPPGVGGFKQIPDMLDPDDLGDEGLVANNHTITQLISFGLKKFTPESLQQRRYLMDLIRSNKLFYATNRNALRDLLSSVIKHQPTVNSFLDWLESVAPIYLSPGEPFYRLMNGGMGAMDPNQQGAMPPFVQQLMGNLPPAQAQMLMQNMFSNNKSAEQQRQAEEDATMDRQVQRLYKVMTIKMLSSAMDPNANQQNQNPMMGMQQQYMMQGYRPSEVIQPDGTRRIEWLPPYAQGGGAQGSPFQDVQSIIGLVSSIISLTGAAGKGTDLNETLTKVFMEKMMADPVDQMLKLKQATEQLGLTRSGPSIDPVKQLELQMNLAKLNNEKDFGMRQLEIQERQLQREEAREAAHEQQSNENISTLMKFVPGVINNMAGPIIQKFFGGGKQEVVPPQPMMGGPVPDGAMFTPSQEDQGIFGSMGNRNKLLKQGAVPLGGIINDNDMYVDPRNDPNAMSGIQEQGELQREAEMRRRIEDEVMHKINTTHLRNNVPPPSVSEPQLSKEQLMNLSNEQLAQVGQMINAERQKYESSINNYNEIVQMRQQEQPVISEEQYQQQEHPPVVDMEEYKSRFNIPEGTDMNDDGVISEEDYESSSTPSQKKSDGGDEVVDFESVDQQQGPPATSGDNLLTEEDDL